LSTLFAEHFFTGLFDSVVPTPLSGVDDSPFRLDVSLIFQSAQRSALGFHVNAPLG